MEKVLSYLRENETKFVEQLCEYVRFPSVSAQTEKHGSDMKACCEWLLAHCRSIGLEAELHPTAGNPILVARTPCRKGRKHFMVYGHYDVQPPEPFELWKTPPFEPRIEGRSLFGRGASDNKGQNFAHLKAVEAYFKTGTKLPVDLSISCCTKACSSKVGACSSASDCCNCGASTWASAIFCDKYNPCGIASRFYFGFGIAQGSTRHKRCFSETTSRK